MTPFARGDVPALVIGKGYTALGAMRCLAMAGIPSYTACPRGDIATASRWFRPPPGLEDWNGSADTATPARLERMLPPRVVVVPCCDDAALWASDLQASPLGARMLACTSSRRTMETLQDKARFAGLLKRLGIPHPWTLPIRTRQDIEDIPFDRLDRIFLKPVNSQHSSQTIGAKGVWAETRPEFLENWQRLDGAGLEFIAQEYVPGGTDDHYFIDGFRDREGTFTGLFARRRLRIYPADFGNSSYCRSIPLEMVGSALPGLRRLLVELDYRGIFSAEFKLDARTGTLRLLEVNTRAWWYVEFAARCGMNVCAMAYEDSLGLPVSIPEQPYRTGKGCVNLGFDLKSVRDTAPGRRPRLAPLLRQWATAHYHVMRGNDPGPSLLLMRLWLRRRWRRMFPPRTPAGTVRAPPP